jgi:hypothetical protein
MMRVESNVGAKSPRFDRRNGLGSCKHDAPFHMSFSIFLKNKPFSAAC